MTEKFVDAAFGGEPGSNTAYFFAVDQYVTYDWSKDRTNDGIHPLSELGLGAPFAPPGPTTQLDAALRGKGPYAGFSYFFRGSDYMRYRWSPPQGVDPTTSQPLSLWKLPWSRVDAAYNGFLNRERYCYFFQDSDYVRYSWATGIVDTGYPKPITNMIGIPPAFAGGVDAAVDGDGPYGNVGYLFRDDRYLRFQWEASAEPHGDGDDVIQGNWPGLAELLAAARAKCDALQWLAMATAQTAAQIVTLSTNATFPFDQALFDAALSTHFHVDLADPAASKLPTVTAISAMLTNIIATLGDPLCTARFRTDVEAIADGNLNVDAAYVSPWPPGPTSAINVTRNFLSRSKLNRVSSIIHEAVHMNDAASASPSTHISEWYVTAPTATALGLTFVPDMPPTTFATRYDLMTTANALHNPASYATFARHLFFRADTRENP